MSSADTTSAAFFETKYRDSADPWHFAESGYELGRYQTIVEALRGRRYRFAWEPGCSVGVLTAQLATFCDRVDASDLSPTAVEQARARCVGLPGVTVRCASITDAGPLSEYDLIVLSEIGYYLTASGWSAIVCRIVDAMPPGGILLASHWLGSSRDHLLHGDEVHALMHDARLEHELGQRHADERHGGFRLDRWRRRI